jgi:hypothetical protein
MTAVAVTHHLAIIDRYGNQIRGKVVSIQPKKECWREQTALVHIVISDWLDPDWYKAVYRVGGQLFVGKYLPYRYKVTEDRWLLTALHRAELVESWP